MMRGMRAPIVLLAAAALAAGTVAGCGDDEEPGRGPAAEGRAATAPEGDVGMRNLRFDPEVLRVDKGDEVTWVNRESIQHNVVAREGADFESELLDQDETFSVEADDEGTIAYLCTLHPGMKGRIVVED